MNKKERSFYSSYRAHSKLIFLLSIFILPILPLSFKTHSSQKVFSILYTHSGLGYLEPCSCPRSRSGGISRRSTLLSRLKKNPSHTLTLDAGNFLSLEESKTDSLMLSFMEQLGYDALNLSQSEIVSPLSFPKHLVLSTNITHSKPNIPKYIELEREGVRFLVLGITTPSAVSLVRERIQNDIKVTPPLLAIGEAIRKTDSDVIIVLLHSLDNQLERSIAESYEDVNVIISTTFAAEHPSPRIFKNTIVTGLEEGGEKVGELKIQYSPKSKSVSLISHKRFLLDSSIYDDKLISDQIKSILKKE